jgi:hypothetical protein
MCSLVQLHYITGDSHNLSTAITLLLFVFRVIYVAFYLVLQYFVVRVFLFHLGVLGRAHTIYIYIVIYLYIILFFSYKPLGSVNFHTSKIIFSYTDQTTLLPEVSTHVLVANLLQMASSHVTIFHFEQNITVVI